MAWCRNFHFTSVKIGTWQTLQIFIGHVTTMTRGTLCSFSSATCPHKKVAYWINFHMTRVHSDRWQTVYRFIWHMSILTRGILWKFSSDTGPYWHVAHCTSSLWTRVDVDTWVTVQVFCRTRVPIARRKLYKFWETAFSGYDILFRCICLGRGTKILYATCSIFLQHNSVLLVL